ncbi:glutathione peroxidase [Luteibacter sp. PPL201]|uniref:Glutathione peroxidase n=1 Tax=Luteibacter sahnii TaxID=3021977 RepID=A0ABT6BCU2_9GAMM|nr:glutathione peroxidase [Luteibacter sp. PPL193]MDY1547658.1 glutathione peroxidase [Luteibacter sp. PPL193]
MTLNDIPLQTIDGEPTSLAAYEGRVLLIVNVASKCGLTPQYESLEALFEARRAEGLVVLGFPANNFANQEPGADEDIKSFCSLTYDVSFPMFSKISVRGDDIHPLYDALTTARPERVGGETLLSLLTEKGLAPATATEVMWNFEKFLVGRDGEVVARFGPDVTVDDPRVIAAIDGALAR